MVPFTKNVGEFDAVVREILALVLFVAGVVFIALQSSMAERVTSLGLLTASVFVFATARARYCPLYHALRLSTVRQHKTPKA